MLLRSTISTFVLVAALGAARAQAIDTVAPAVGSPGQVITIDGSGLLGTGGVAKPVVFLRDPVTLKKSALKVTAFTPTQLTVEFAKGAPGVRDLVVKPKGEAEIVSASAFEVKAPVFIDVDSGGVEPDHADPGTPVTVNGQFLGTLKGSVLLGGKKTVVSSWTDDAVVFTVPAKVASGFYSIKLLNKAGSTAVSFALVIGNGVTVTHKPDSFAAKVDNKKFTVGSFLGLNLIFASFDETPDPPAPQVPTVTISSTGPTIPGLPTRHIDVNIPFDISLDEAQPLPAGDVNSSVSYTETVDIFTFTVWDSLANNVQSIVVLSLTDNQLIGEFSGTLDRSVGTGGNPTVVVKKGKFRATLAP